MMQIYVRIQDGKVIEVIEPVEIEGVAVPIEERFHPDFIATLISVTNLDPMPQEHWSYDGKVFTPPPAPSVDALRDSALTEIRAQRSPILDALSGIAVDAFVSGDQVTAEAVVSVRQQLKDLTILPAFLAATTYDDMKAAIMGRYREIAAAAPEAVQKAFREVL